MVSSIRTQTGVILHLHCFSLGFCTGTRNDFFANKMPTTRTTRCAVWSRAPFWHVRTTKRKTRNVAKRDRGNESRAINAPYRGHPVEQLFRAALQLRIDVESVERGKCLGSKIFHSQILLDMLTTSEQILIIVASICALMYCCCVIGACRDRVRQQREAAPEISV